MHGNIEEFKQKFHDLTDEALVAVDREELIDSARQCYDEELASRSLPPAPPPEPPPPAEGSGPVDELVCVGTFILKQDFDLARSILESAEISCFQPDEHMSDIAPYLIPSFGMGRLLVPASSAEQARELLAPMLAEANKAILSHWFERVWNGGHEGDAATFGAGADPHLRALLPDLRVTVDEMVAEADKVAARITIQGAHQGAPVQFHGVVFARMQGGRIVDTWDMNDAPTAL
jgi:hypothetical protein